jgi:hypothetical protein
MVFLNQKKKPRLRRSLGFKNNKENFGVSAMALGMTIGLLLCKNHAKNRSKSLIVNRLNSH